MNVAVSSTLSPVTVTPPLAGSMGVGVHITSDKITQTTNIEEQDLTGTHSFKIVFLKVDMEIFWPNLNFHLNG